MTEETARNRKVRGKHRASTKRTINACFAILDDFDPLNMSLVNTLTQQRITLTEKLNILKDLDEKILQGTEEIDIEKEIEDCDLMREHIHVTIVRIDSSLIPADVSTSASGTGNIEGTVNQNLNSVTQPAAKVKLPKLNLKWFKGDVKEGTSFWDSFS